MYETFEHTADLGLRVRAADLGGLFSEAGRALMTLLVEDPGAVPESRIEHVELSAGRLDDLFRDWLQEMLYLFEARRLVGTTFSCSLSDRTLSATVRGATYDPRRHGGLEQIKAVTYHGLRLERTPEGYQAEVILDV